MVLGLYGIVVSWVLGVVGGFLDFVEVCCDFGWVLLTGSCFG